MRRWTVAFGFVLLATALARDARAQEDATARAREAFNRGVELYDQARYAEALVSFREAFDLRPHPSVRVNMANCLARLDRSVEATYHFRRYMSERGEDLTPAQRTDVQREIDGMRMEVAEIEVTLDPRSAELYVDGERPATRIRSTVYLAPGEHVIEARKEGMVTAREEINLSGGARRRMTLTLTEETSAPVPTPVPVPEGEAPPPESTPEAEAEAEDEPTTSTAAEAHVDTGGFYEYLPWIAAGGAVLSLGVAVAFGASALSAEDEFDSSVAAYKASTDEDDRRVLRYNAEEWKDAADIRALWADIFLVLTVAAGGAAAYLFLYADLGGESSSVAASPVLTPEGGGIVVMGPLAP